MDHQYIEEHNLIERYVLGRLPVEDQVRFEEHFADCSACLDALELAGDFNTALRTVVADDARRAVGTGIAALLIRWLRGPRAAVLLGALMVVMALPALWLVVENQRLAGDLEGLRRPRAEVPSFLLTLSRDDAAPVPSLAVPAGQTWLMLAIEADDEFAHYGMTLKDDAGGIRWRGEGLEPTLWGVLQLTLAADFLSPGLYRLELEGYDAAGRSEPVGSYPFRIATP